MIANSDQKRATKVRLILRCAFRRRFYYLAVDFAISSGGGKARKVFLMGGICFANGLSVKKWGE